MHARSSFLPILLLVFALLPHPLQAQQERELEGWQQRILEALEESGQTRGERRSDNDNGRRALATPGGPDPGAGAAAERARERYGGRPLAVVRSGDGYRVRLLLDDGRVTTVEIRD